MGLFSTIMSKVFGQPAKPAVTTAPAKPASAAPSASAATPAPAPPATAAAAPPAPAALPPIDVTAFLDALAKKNPEKLDWKKSIVDLLKLLEMDSSLGSRRALATELNFRGDPADSAALNIWLHKEVIRQFAANGGKVPAELLD